MLHRRVAGCGGDALIRTLVVDDDFRVAHIHAASVERVDGFVCVGQAFNATQARASVAELRPDLLILDIYLPDEDGLTLLRSLAAAGSAPDTIFITAARDVSSVRAAIGLGAIHYLVKPFGFAQLREQLRAYQNWRDRLVAEADAPADQATVDNLIQLLRGPGIATGKSTLPPTMARILDAVRQAVDPIGATGVAAELGISRPTAQRYLSDLERRRLVELQLSYGSTGRPEHRYRAIGS